MFEKKKRMEIYGTLEMPLSVGHAAFIKESGFIRRTSVVKHFIIMPSGTIYIETKNTRYILKPMSAFAESGVRV